MERSKAWKDYQNSQIVLNSNNEINWNLFFDYKKMSI